jgi:hypothetical protein
MPFFILRFSGLCAFVPNQPFGGEVAPESIQVLIPNLLRARALSPVNGVLPTNPEELNRSILPPHYPMMSFDMKFRRDDPALKEPEYLVIQESTGADKIGVLMLLEQDVSIRPDGQEPQPGSLSLVNDPVPDPLHPTPQQERSIFWLTKLEEVLSELLVPERRRLTSRLRVPPAAGETDVIARIQFSAGELSTSRLTPKRWELRPAGNPPQVTAGRRVAVELALVIEAQRLDLVVRNFGSDEPTTLSFAPPVSDPEANVEIRIQNLEPERLVGIPIDNTQPVPSLDSDFEIYYPLLQDFDPVAVRPIPQRIVRSGDDFISAGGKPCSPSGINP